MSMIYFISDGDHVKIGFTKRNPEERLAELQTANPKSLRLIHVTHGNSEKVQGIYQKFKHLRLKGEWFKLNEEMQNFIYLLRSNSKDYSHFESFLNMWFQLTPKARIKKFLTNITQCAEQAYRRGYHDGFKCCLEIINKTRPIAIEGKKIHYWKGKISKHFEELEARCSAVKNWRFQDDYDKAIFPPHHYTPPDDDITETALEKHCRKFKTASEAIFLLADLRYCFGISETYRSGSQQVESWQIFFEDSDPMQDPGKKFCYFNLKDKVKEILIETARCWEGAYRRGYYHGFNMCVKIIKHIHPVAWEKIDDGWRSIPWKGKVPSHITDIKIDREIDRYLKYNIESTISSKIADWRFQYDYEKATPPPPTSFKKTDIKTSLDKHCSIFRDSSEFIGELVSFAFE